MQASAGNEEFFKVQVVCPVCDKFEYLQIPKEGILSSKRGLSTVFVHNQLVCEHSFQIFIDKNGSVRGFETPDFELKFSLEEKIPTSAEPDSVNTLLLLKAVLSEEFLLKSLRCGLNKHDIICITENETLKMQYEPFFQKLFGSYAPSILTSSLEEYNQNIRNKVYGSEHKTTFVFNPDIGVVIKEPFDKKFKIEKFSFENSFLHLININIDNDEAIINKLYLTLLKILDSAKVVVEQVKSKKIKNRKATIQKFQELIGKEIKCGNDDMDRMMKFHFDYIPELTFLDF
jgi:hypothetical protein